MKKSIYIQVWKPKNPKTDATLIVSNVNGNPILGKSGQNCYSLEKGLSESEEITEDEAQEIFNSDVWTCINSPYSQVFTNL
jgi:hypothetical protein